MSASPSLVWPPSPRPWPLSALTEAQWQHWEEHGYLAIPDAIPAPLARAAAVSIREYVGAEEHNRSSWYRNTLDIYTDVDENGRKPHHGPCGMVQMFHHHSLWAIRQDPRLHAIFADMWGTPELWVTCDRAHFKPPRDERFAAWSDPGDVHVGVHWDVDTRSSAWPVPYTIQGVVYLEETLASQGALRVVPGFHRGLAGWSDRQPANRSAERPEGTAADELNASAVSVAGDAGTLVLWHSAIPHGPGANFGWAPRISAYVTMHPVDASPFLGEGRPADSPLGMNDAGTTAYLEETDHLKLTAEEADAEGGHSVGDADAGSCVEGGVAAASANAPPPPGVPRSSSDGRPRRQSRERRVERWRYRLPLLDEDPKEGELSRMPPGEEHGQPAKLTPRGERLVGVRPWR
jgi:hypothetical protein